MKLLLDENLSVSRWYSQESRNMFFLNLVLGILFDETFVPDPDKTYYIHADLAQKHDKCAVAIAHVDKWVNIQVIKDYEQVAPIVVVDAVAWLEPRAEGPVNLSEVKQWIINLRRQGFCTLCALNISG